MLFIFLDKGNGYFGLYVFHTILNLFGSYSFFTSFFLGMVYSKLLLLVCSVA